MVAQKNLSFVIISQGIVMGIRPKIIENIMGCLWEAKFCKTILKLSYCRK